MLFVCYDLQRENDLRKDKLFLECMCNSGSSPGQKTGPGVHCLRIHQIVPRFLVHHIFLYIINPLHMRKRVTVVCLSVCISVNVQTARVLNSAVQTWYYQNRHGLPDTRFGKVFDSWISLKWLCSKVVPSFTFRSTPPYVIYCR